MSGADEALLRHAGKQVKAAREDASEEDLRLFTRAAPPVSRAGRSRDGRTEMIMTSRPLRGARTVECPYCHAPAGELCRRSGTSPFRRRGGATVPQAHTSRVELARERAGQQGENSSEEE